MYKHDEGKARLDLIDPKFMSELGDILRDGAKKYSEGGWKTIPNAKERYYAAAMRHLVAYKDGSAKDEESGCSHLMHAAANIMFLRWFERENVKVREEAENTIWYKAAMAAHELAKGECDKCAFKGECDKCPFNGNCDMCLLNGKCPAPKLKEMFQKRKFNDASGVLGLATLASIMINFLHKDEGKDNEEASSSQSNN